MDTQVIQNDLSIEDKIRVQVEYYLSRENLANDAYLSRQMNREMFVPVTVIASFPKIKNLTTDIELIIKSISKSSSVILDETQKLVKPSFKLQRNIIILRDIAQSTPLEEIKSIFNNLADSIVSIKNDIVNTWFITFDNEENASKAYDSLQSATFKDKPIKVRIKSETLLRNNYKPHKPESLPANVGPNVNGSSRYYTVSGGNSTPNGTHNSNSKWQRTVGGYPYGGWDQGELRQTYDPSKGSAEGSHRKPYRGNKDSTSRPRREYNSTHHHNSTTTPSSTLNNNQTALNNNNSSNSIESTNNLNNTTTTTTTPSTTTSSPNNNFSGERYQRRPHSKSHMNGKPSHSANGTVVPPTANGTTTAPSTTTTTESTTSTSQSSRKPRESKQRHSKNANGANKSSKSSASSGNTTGTTSEEKEKEKPKQVLTPPGPQHFPPLVKGESADTEMKKKEWGPASTSSPVVAAASLPPVVATPTATTPAVAAPSSPVATSVAATSTTTSSSATSPAQQSGKSSKKVNGQSSQTPTKKSRESKDGKSKSSPSSKKNTKEGTTKTAENNANSNNNTSTTSPASESPKVESANKQPTYADIIQGLAKQPAVTASAPVTETPVPAANN